MHSPYGSKQLVGASRHTGTVGWRFEGPDAQQVQGAARVLVKQCIDQINFNGGWGQACRQIALRNGTVIKAIVLQHKRGWEPIVRVEVFAPLGHKRPQEDVWYVGFLLFTPINETTAYTVPASVPLPLPAGSFESAIREQSTAQVINRTAAFLAKQYSMRLPSDLPLPISFPTFTRLSRKTLPHRDPATKLATCVVSDGVHGYGPKITFGGVTLVTFPSDVSTLNYDAYSAAVYGNMLFVSRTKTEINKAQQVDIDFFAVPLCECPFKSIDTYKITSHTIHLNENGVTKWNLFRVQWHPTKAALLVWGSAITQIDSGEYTANEWSPSLEKFYIDAPDDMAEGVHIGTGVYAQKYDTTVSSIAIVLSVTKNTSGEWRAEITDDVIVTSYEPASIAEKVSLSGNANCTTLGPYYTDYDRKFYSIRSLAANDMPSEYAISGVNAIYDAYFDRDGALTILSSSLTSVNTPERSSYAYDLNFPDAIGDPNAGWRYEHTNTTSITRAKRAISEVITTIRGPDTSFVCLNDTVRNECFFGVYVSYEINKTTDTFSQTVPLVHVNFKYEHPSLGGYEGESLVQIIASDHDTPLSHRECIDHPYMFSRYPYLMRDLVSNTSYTYHYGIYARSGLPLFYSYMYLMDVRHLGHPTAMWSLFADEWTTITPVLLNYAPRTGEYSETITSETIVSSYSCSVLDISAVGSETRSEVEFSQRLHRVFREEIFPDEPASPKPAPGSTLDWEVVPFAYTQRHQLAYARPAVLRYSDFFTRDTNFEVVPDFGLGLYYVKHLGPDSGTEFYVTDGHTARRVADYESVIPF